MRKKLTAIGNSVGLIIDKPILELLGLDKDDEVEIRSDGKRLVITPKTPRRKALIEAARRIMKKHDKTFRRLAE